MTSLNLFQDIEPLLSDNYEKQINRLFKSSKIAPFSSNVAFVLLKCNETTENKYKIKILINELPVGLINSGSLFCQNNQNKANFSIQSSLCAYQEFKNRVLNDNRDCFKLDLCDMPNHNEEL